MKNVIAILLFCASQTFAATYYVDANATGTPNGTSWVNAWRHPTAITGVGAGDIVYISGGTTSKTYNFSAIWMTPQGVQGNPVIIRNGRDAGHTGTVIFNTSVANLLIADTLNWITFDFYTGPLDVDPYTQYSTLLANCKLRFQGVGTGVPYIFGGSDGVTGGTYEAGDSIGFTLRGAQLSNGRLYLYDSRKTHIEYCVFNTDGVKFPGGFIPGTDRYFPGDGWILGVGRYDPTGYGNNSIHHCRFNLFHVVPPINGENGDDGVANVGSMDFYNNAFVSTKLTSGTWAGNNHQDFIQTDGWYIRIFNNYMESAANYCIFGEFWGPTYGGWRVYNNIFNASDSEITGTPSVAVAIGYKYSANFVSDLYVFNNLVRGWNRSIDVATAGYASVATNVYITNNLRFGGGHIVFNGTGATITNNADATSGYFVNSAAGDFHLTSGAVNALGAGTTTGGVTSITTTDKDGATRTVPWDIGPYEFAPAVGPGVITLAASSYSTAEGVNVTITANRVNGSSGAVGCSYTTTGGTATEGTDYTDATGTFSWANADSTAKTVTITVAQDALVEGAEGFTFAISSPTGGATLGAITSVPVTITDDEPPVIPLMGGLTFEAEAGLIEAPFVVSGGAISQSVDTNAGLGGLARYRVTIPSTGNYTMSMLIYAPSSGADSLFVDWDQDPAEGTTIFDVGVTSGFETKSVSWRGSGGPSTPQFNPKSWTLSAGVRTLWVRGREPGMELGLITVIPETLPDVTAPTPNPPTWELAPIPPVGAEGQTSITMTVAPVSDASGPVQYFFNETTSGSGATDSSWQADPHYVDTGLIPGTLYSYQVKARDSLGNETSYTVTHDISTRTPDAGVQTINATNLHTQ